VTAGQHEQDFSIRTLGQAESASRDEIRKFW
jgi:hypothetical protein